VGLEVKHPQRLCHFEKKRKRRKVKEKGEKSQDGPALFLCNS
jgi:hypothetical protein